MEPTTTKHLIIDAEPVETIEAPNPSAQQWLQLAAASLALAAVIVGIAS